RLGRLLGRRWRLDADRADPHRNTAGLSRSSATAVITPRRTRLIRAADLHEFRQVIAGLQRGTDSAFVVPTRAAAVQLARSFAEGRRCVLVTRDQLYELLHTRLDNPPRRLNAFEREAIAQAAADDALRETGDLPFQIRPGLIGEIVRFY